MEVRNEALVAEQESDLNGGQVSPIRAFESDVERHLTAAFNGVIKDQCRT